MRSLRKLVVVLAILVSGCATAPLPTRLPPLVPAVDVQRQSFDDAQREIERELDADILRIQELIATTTGVTHPPFHVYTDINSDPLLIAQRMYKDAAVDYAEALWNRADVTALLPLRAKAIVARDAYVAAYAVGPRVEPVPEAETPPVVAPPASPETPPLAALGTRENPPQPGAIAPLRQAITTPPAGSILVRGTGPQPLPKSVTVAGHAALPPREVWQVPSVWFGDATKATPPGFYFPINGQIAASLDGGPWLETRDRLYVPDGPDGAYQLRVVTWPAVGVSLPWQEIFLRRLNGVWTWVR